MKILVVEDDLFSMKLIMSYLEKHAHKVRAAVSGKAAIRILEDESGFDLIVSDIMMPHVDGFELLRMLRNDRRLRRIPVILCTALGDQESVKKARGLNVAGYIVKPIVESVLIDKIDTIQKLKTGSILIVDKESIIRNLLHQILERGGWDVLESETGPQAIEILKSTDIELVMSEIDLDSVDGFELLAMVKEYNHRIPVVLISMRGQYQRNEVIGAGADDFIAKPFRNMEVLLRVESLLKKKDSVKKAIAT